MPTPGTEKNSSSCPLIGCYSMTRLVLQVFQKQGIYIFHSRHVLTKKNINF